MSVRRAQLEVDAHEFSEWVSYFALDPFVEDRIDVAAARISATIAAALSGKAQKLQDFMPRWDMNVERQTPKHMWNVIQQFGALMQGNKSHGRHCKSGR